MEIVENWPDMPGGASTPPFGPLQPIPKIEIFDFCAAFLSIRYILGADFDSVIEFG